MYIDNLTISAQQSRRTVSENIHEPEWPQIREAVVRLSQQGRSWLTLDAESGQLTVGNDAHGYSVCAYDPDMDTCLRAQPGLDLQGALLAVKAFALGGCLTDRLAWHAA